MIKIKNGHRMYFVNLILILIISFSVIWSLFSFLGMEKLAYFFSFMVLATTVLPTYTPPVVLYTGMFYSALTVAIVGAIASTLGCLLDYIIIGGIASSRYFSKYQNTPFMGKTKRYFKANGFLTLMFFAMTPFPFEPVKILAIFSKYDIKRYALAISISRGFRYYLLASLTLYLTLSRLVIISVVFAFAFVIKFGLNRRRLRERKNRSDVID